MHTLPRGKYFYWDIISSIHFFNGNHLGAGVYFLQIYLFFILLLLYFNIYYNKRNTFNKTVSNNFKGGHLGFLVVFVVKVFYVFLP